MAPSSGSALRLRDVTLDDKYQLESGRVYLTGVQALVRLLMLQRQRDVLAGLNTAGFVSGYRGSPLGALDLSLWGAEKFLSKAHIQFQPGLNEDLAATAIWGTQQVNLYPGAKYDGVFAMWYGKGPGVDRCGDVFKHANFAGTSKHGGVLVLAGDDHAAKSSTLPHQSDHQFSAAMMPVLYPSSVQEIIDLGLHGWAMSRYSGLLGRLQMRVRHRRKLGLGLHRPRPREADHARRLSVSAGRRVHPLARRVPRHRSADAGLQDLRGAALLPRQPSEPHRHRFTQAAARHHHQRQELSRRASGARRSGHHRGRRGRDRHPRVQGGDALAARARGRAPLRRRPGRDPGGRGEAADRRVPAEGAALQLARRRASARGRQVRRKGRMGAPARRLAAARRLRAHAGDDRARDRAAHRAAGPASAHHGKGAQPRRVHQRQGSGARQAQDQPAAHSVFLLGLPAQHVDQGSRRQPRDRGHRLSRDGDLDGPLDVDLHPHGRRRRAVDRPGAVHQRKAHLRQPRRRHVLPLRHPGDPRGGRGQRQHHLQDPLQRRGGDDRRPAGRRPALAVGHRAAGRRRRREENRRRHRRAGEISVRLFRFRHRNPPSRRARSRAAHAARYAGRAPSCSTTRPAPPKSAAAASAASIPIPPSAWSSTSWCAKAAAIAA